MSENLPNYDDVLVYEDISSVITHEILEEVAVELETIHLSLATPNQIVQENHNPLIRGVLYGIYHKPMIECIIASPLYKQYIHVVFVIDPTGSHTYLSTKTWVALGFTEKTPETGHFLFRDRTYPAEKTPSNKEVNVLGYRSLRDMRCCMELDYKQLEVYLRF